MEKRLAKAYAGALSLVAGSTVGCVVVKSGDDANRVSTTCVVDHTQPLTCVSGQWLISLSIQDMREEFRFDPWIKRYKLPSQTRRKGQPEAYRFMGAASVKTTKNRSVVVKFRDGPQEVTFELIPIKRTPAAIWRSVALSIAEAMNDTIGQSKRPD